MSGFVGICGLKINNSTNQVEAGLRDTVYSTKSTSNVVIDEKEFVLGQSYFRFEQCTGWYCDDKNISVIINGEIYNNTGHADIAAQFREHYLRGTLDSYLSQLDGYFQAVIYDRIKKHVLVITDRYGLRPLYFFHGPGALMLACEVKSFLNFPSFTPELRKDMIDSFLHLEHFLGDHTWFHNVVTAEPSSLYTYDIVSGNFTSRKYWNWKHLSVRTDLNVNEAADHLAILFSKAVHKRINGGTLGISLSGGLDSRALLAETQDLKPITFTFGIGSSEDVAIARQVAKRAGVEHIFFNIHTPDWLESRFAGVWKTDGMFNMYHMHYSQLMDTIPKYIDVNLSGFLGDAVLGGSYLSKGKDLYLNRQMTEEIASRYYGRYSSQSRVSDPYFGLNKVDPYLFYNRGRRMIGLGLEEAHKTIGQRVPFMDHELMDFAYSLPDEFRVDSTVYNMALLRMYPDFFRDIPWQKTGVPISRSHTIAGHLLKKYHFWKNAFRYKLGLPVSFTHVSRWLREGDTARRIGEILNPATALYPSFTQRNLYQEFVVPHNRGDQKKMKGVMGALTLEIWLQQVFNKRYRS